MQSSVDLNAKKAQQPLADEVLKKLEELKAAPANSLEARKIAKEIFLLFTNGKTEEEIGLAFLRELAKYNENDKNNTLIINALKSRESVVDANAIEALEPKSSEVRRINNFIKEYGLSPDLESNSQEEKNKKIIFEAVAFEACAEIVIHITNPIGNFTRELSEFNDLKYKLDSTSAEKLNFRYFFSDALQIICADAILNKKLDISLEKTSDGIYVFNQNFHADVKKIIDATYIYLKDDEKFDSFFARSIKALFTHVPDFDAIREDWLRNENSLTIDNNRPINADAKEIAHKYFKPQIADYVAGKAHQGGFSQLTQTFYSFKLSKEKNLILPSESNEINPELNILRKYDFISQPDGSVFYVERFAFSYYIDSKSNNPNQTSTRKDAYIADMVAISRISVDELGKLSHDLVTHNVFLLDEIQGQKLFDLKNDKNIVRAFDKSNEDVNTAINDLIKSAPDIWKKMTEGSAADRIISSLTTSVISLFRPKGKEVIRKSRSGSVSESESLSTTSSSSSPQPENKKQTIINEISNAFTYARDNQEKNRRGITTDQLTKIKQKTKTEPAKDGELGFAKYQIAREFEHELEQLNNKNLSDDKLIDEIRGLIKKHNDSSTAVRTHTVSGKEVISNPGSLEKNFAALEQRLAQLEKQYASPNRIIINKLIEAFTYTRDRRAKDDVSDTRYAELLVKTKTEPAKDGELGFAKYKIATELKKQLRELETQPLTPADLITEAKRLIDHYRQLSATIRTHAVSGKEIVAKPGRLEENFDKLEKLLGGLGITYKPASPRV